MKYRLRIKITLTIAASLMIAYLCVKIAVLAELRESTETTKWIEFFGVISFIPISILLIKDFVNSTKNSVSKESVDKMEQADKFLSTAAIISMTDKYGKITFVNDKFEKVSGWKLEEVIGKDHSIVNSGTQPDGYWGKMYEKVMKGEIWNDVVTNKAKNGSLYYVDTYIRARFDSKGNLEGFSSIRQDVTELKKKQLENHNRMTAINKSNAVIEFDLD
jgi:PAS domain S-box-containing protein